MVHAIYITPSLRPYKDFLCYYYCQMNPIKKKKKNLLSNEWCESSTF